MHASGRKQTLLPAARARRGLLTGALLLQLAHRLQRTQLAPECPSEEGEEKGGGR